ncbi:MAG: PrsW family intramembrane metalloprotease [Oscillospiraceae bacterium]|nr:PrsW family intramembrane metalloprotease [Oscillospiraceae bacterium]
MGGSNLSLVMYVCFLIPMLLSLFSLGRRERLAVGSILVGATVCLAVSGLNAHLYVLTGRDMLYYTTTISPITEEIVKALPVLVYAFAVSSDRDRLISISFAVGLGFAIMENMIIFTQNLSDMNVMWAIVRGFGAGLMHSVCTVAVGIGISLVRTKKKLFYCGTAALLMMAVTYHAIFNTVALSAYRTLGFALPVLTYIPILCLRIREKNTKTV